MIATARIRAALVAVALFALPLSGPLRAEDEGYVTYEVRRGDTLYGLARAYLLGSDAAARVQRLNRIADPRRIPIRHRLRIPRALLRFEPVALRVAGFNGPVEIDGQAPALGVMLAEGQTVATGRSGFVSFRSARGAQISLPSNTTAQLARARRYLLGDLLDIDFTVLGGRGEAKSPTLKEQERFRLRTPRAVTAVRGTEFRIAYDETGELSLTEVVEGAVKVAAGSAERIAPAGFGVAAQGNKVGEAETLLPAPRLIEPGAVQTGEQLVFAIAPADGATGFHTQIARDAGFLEVLDERTTPDGQVVFPALANGRYFVRARAISPSRLQGLSETHSFRRKRLGITAEAERTPLADGYRFTWLATGEDEILYAFRMWREGSEAKPVVDETGLQASGLVLTGLEPGVYYWRVAALQAVEEGLLKVWSPDQKLIVSQ